MSIVRVFALAFLAWLALPSAEAPFAGTRIAQAQTTGDPSFALVNRSGRTINAAFASLSTETNWGADRLGANVVLPNGQRFQLNLPQGPCQWDIAVVYDDGRREEKRNQNLCAVTELAFDASQARAVAPAPTAPGGQQARPAPPAATGDPSFALVNRSARTITEAFASLANDANWGNDRLGANTVLPAGQRFQINLPQGPCRWNLAVIYDDGRREEKRNQDLCAVTEVAFDASQARAGAAGPAQPQQRQPSGPSFGTGFFVSSQGHMLTNAHVAGDCRSIVVHLDGARANATMVRKDETNDLALLRVDVRQASSFARFRAGAAIRPGDDVVVAGFPLPQVLQNGLNITTGNVSAMAGLGGNTALMQITAPVQPGNSGGPLLDMAGNVVGVIVSKLDAQRIARVTGDIPQNVNFAVQGAVARIFLEAGGQRATEAPSARDMRAADVGEQSRNFTFQIECR